VRWHEERLGRVRGPRGEKWTGIAELLLAYVADKSEISRPVSAACSRRGPGAF
jgi:hypothetical protein